MWQTGINMLNLQLKLLNYNNSIRKLKKIMKFNFKINSLLNDEIEKKLI
jgi:hypothetical protein